MAHLFKFPTSLPLPEKKARVQCGKLDAITYYWLVVGAKLRERSLSSQIQSLLTAQVARWQPEWLSLLEYKATQAGITPEEMFVRLATGDEGTEEK